MREIPIQDVRAHQDLQPRATTEAELVTEYAEAMEAGEDFPPLRVTWDGEQFWLTDGFHRYAALLKIGAPTARVEVTDGTRREAMLSALAANARHGKRRTRADKRRAIKRMLADEEWATWSDREIARHLRVDHKTVGKYREEMESSGEIPQINRRKVARNGNTYSQDTANIGASPAPPVSPREEDREVPVVAPTSPVLGRIQPASAPVTQSHAAILLEQWKKRAEQYEQRAREKEALANERLARIQALERQLTAARQAAPRGGALLRSVLGVGTDEELKSLRKRALAAVHPDRGGDPQLFRALDGLFQAAGGGR